MTNQRFLSLDVFRGMTICLMIIVNTPGDGAATFAHFYMRSGMALHQPIWFFLLSYLLLEMQ